VLVLEAVSYRYAGAERPAIRQVSLTLDKGEVLGVVGPSEAGKTTLCLVASGLAPRAIRGAMDGRVLLDGADTTALPMHEMAARAGICFQHPQTQISGICGTVFEEIAFGPMNLGLQRDDVVVRTWDALDVLGITALAERDPMQLSGGQMQLVAIGGLLALRPAHLILDEPTAQLDPGGTRLVGECLARLAAGGASILITEQKTDLLERICGRVVVLEKGGIVAAGPTDEVLAAAGLAAMGVAAPSRVRVRRALAGAGFGDGAIMDALH